MATLIKFSVKHIPDKYNVDGFCSLRNKTGKVYSAPEYTFHANSEVLIKYYVTYLTYTTSVSNYTNHAALKSSLINVNQDRYVITRVNSVAAYWTRTHGVMG
jgi:hypothetical protein